MKTNEHYKIVSAGDAAQLEQIISNMIKDGWIPTGGITPAYGKRSCQAMWKPPLPDVIKIKMEAATNMEPIAK
tara:strand:+ start:71 stop:289 length:219 start_codon:yes stop_codon:yes gene_type:complete